MNEVSLTRFRTAESHCAGIGLAIATMGSKAGRLGRFAAVSAIGWGIDTGVFLLLVTLGLAPALANFASASCGVGFVYIVGRFRVFAEARSSHLIAVPIYIAWNIVAILIASVAISFLTFFIFPAVREASMVVFNERPFLSSFALAALLSKIAVTPFSMYGNYVVMGLIVERRLRLN
ncbi:MAG: GtrA family protein [Sphingomonas sp.]